VQQSRLAVLFIVARSGSTGRSGTSGIRNAASNALAAAHTPEYNQKLFGRLCCALCRAAHWSSWRFLAGCAAAPASSQSL
jgi:hypothetical protein